MSATTEPTATPPQDASRSHKHSRRKKHTVFFDLTETADARFDRVIEWFLILLLAFAPLAIGGVQAWGELVVFAIAGSMATLLAVKLVCRPQIAFIWSWTYLPILLFLSLPAIQLIPLPAWVVKVIAPNTFELKQSLLIHAPNSLRSLGTMTLTFYPEATWHDLRLLIAISAVFVVTLNVIRQQRQIERLLFAIAVIGGGIAIIGFLHLAFQAEHVYGVIGRLSSSWPIAPFINRNHFGQFMNLSLGAGLALLLGQIEQLIRSRRRSSTSEGDILSLISPVLWVVGICVIVTAVGAFLSLSRGTMISLILAGLLSMIAAPKQGITARIWLLAPAGLLVAMTVIFFGFDEIIGRFADGDSRGMSTGGRLEIVRDALNGWKQFPIFGIGLGNFETFFPMIDRSSILNVATHAENEYVQILLEGGIVGLGMVIWFLSLIVLSYRRCLRSMPSISASMAPGLGFAILAVALQSFSDFGQHAPANAALSAVLCALIVTFAEASLRTKALPEKTLVLPNSKMRWAAGAFCAALFTAILLQGFSVARAEAAWYSRRELDDRLQSRNWRGDDEEYARLLLASSDASVRRPGDIHYLYALNFYRLKSISRERDPKSGQLLLTNQQIQWAGEIAQRLLEGIPVCPTFGPVYSLAGEIQSRILEKHDEGAANIREGFRLSRTDPAANFETALLDAEAQQWESALQKMKHASQLMSGYLDEGVDALTRDFHRPDLAMQLAGSDVDAVRRVEAILAQNHDVANLTLVQTKLNEMIEAAAQDRNASAASLVDAGRLAASQKKYELAVKYYERAFQVDYAQPGWRLEFARLLADMGNIQDAMTEAHTAERLGAAEAAQFQLELRLRPASTMPSQKQTAVK